MNPLDRLVQALKKRATQAVSNVKGNIKALSNPQTRSTWVKGFTPTVEKAGSFINKQVVRPITSNPGMPELRKSISSFPLIQGVKKSGRELLQGAKKELYNPSPNILGYAKNVGVPLAKTTAQAYGVSKLPQFGYAGLGLTGGIGAAFSPKGKRIEGATRALEQAPTMAAVGSITNPSITRLSQALGSRFASPVGKQIASRTTSAILNIPETIAYRKALTGKGGYSLSDLPTDLAIGALTGSPKMAGARVKGFDLYKTDLEDIRNNLRLAEKIENIKPGQKIDLDQYKNLEETTNLFKKSYKIGVDDKVWKKMGLTERYNAILKTAAEKYRSGAPVMNIIGKADKPTVQGGVSIKDVTPKGFGPETPQVSTKIPLERLKGETADQAIARKVGYQIDNGFVKLEPAGNGGSGWKATVTGLGDNDKQIFQGFKKEQVLKQVFEKLYPEVDLTGKTLNSVVRGGVTDIKPKTTLLNKIEKLKTKAEKGIFEQKEVAQSKLSQIEQLSSEDLKDISSLRKMSLSKAGQEGDIQTLYKKNPKLVGRVLNRMREISSDYENNANKSDTELLDMALGMPTKSEMRIIRPKELDQVKALKEKAKNVQDLVYNSELDPNIKTALAKKNEKLLKQAAEQEYKEWQSQVFNQTVKEEKTKTKQSLESVFGGIRKSGSTLSSDVDQLNDISGFNAGGRDIFRNFKQVFGKKFGEAKRLVLDPFDQAKGKLFDEYNQSASKLDNDIVKKLGIEKGSDLSAQVQNYGEGKIKPEDWARISPQNQKKIVQADKWFRGEYDRIIGEVNEVRKRIYPNDPTKIIPKRNDYYRHFQEMAQGFQGLLNIFETPAGISSTLSGVSEFAKPRSKWLSFAQKRLGNRSDIDAVGGFLDYIKSAGYAKHIDPQISKFRNLATELAEKTAEGTPQAGKVNNFIEFLQDYANDLSGKTNPLDRTIQKWIPGGRKAFRVIDWLNKRVKANVILLNASSSIAQIFNVPQGIASAGPKYSVKGLGRSLASMFSKNEPQNQSTFIKERYFNAFDKFDKGLVNDTKKFAIWMVGALDEVGTKYIWNSHYEKALAEGIQNPIKYADDMARNMVAGRGIGEVPLAQKSKMFQMIAPFQLEVANLWHVMGDMVGEKAFGKLATLFVMNYLFNRTAEKIRGSDVTIDPIQATIEAIQAFSEEDDKKKGLLRAGGRLGGEVLSNVPVGQTVAAAYPEYGFKVGDFQAPTRKDFFGKGDPTRFGSGLLVTKGLQDPLYKVLPPFGGQQVKRTIEGVGTVNKGYSESATGKVQYPIEKTPGKYVKSAIFGKSSLPEAQDYYGEKRSVLGEKQSELIKEAETPEDRKGYYDEVIRKRSENNLYDALKSNSSFNPKEYDADTQAMAYYRYVTNQPKEKRMEVYNRLKPYITDEINGKIEEISRLKQMGVGQEDQDLAKIPVQLRGKAIYERIMKLDKKNRKQKYAQLQRSGIITPEINNYLVNFKP